MPEAEKLDYYSLADVVAMPGSHPSFDTYPFRFAFLEPLACGLPVVGSMPDDPNEAADPDVRELLILVDPKDHDSICRGVLAALDRGERKLSPALRKFDYGAFEAKLHAILNSVIVDFNKPNSFMR